MPLFQQPIWGVGALMALVIAFLVFQDRCPFLLETIGTCNSRMFPFQGHGYRHAQPSLHFAQPLTFFS